MQEFIKNILKSGDFRTYVLTSGTTKFKIQNEEMNDITIWVKSLEDSTHWQKVYLKTWAWDKRTKWQTVATLVVNIYW